MRMQVKENNGTFYPSSTPYNTCYVIVNCRVKVTGGRMLARRKQDLSILPLTLLSSIHCGLFTAPAIMSLWPSQVAVGAHNSDSNRERENK